MKPAILAAVAVAGFAGGMSADPVLAGADSPPEIRLANLLTPQTRPPRTAVRATAPPSTSRPGQATRGQATRPVPRPAEATGPVVVEAPRDGPDEVRWRLAALKAPSGIGLPLHSEDWIRSQGEASGGDEWECLTQALYFEARGEAAEGVFAVAEVILNRVDSARYPDTVCDVINQGTGRKFACQFTYTCDGLPEHVSEPGAWVRVGKVARAMLGGAPRALTDGALFYHATHVEPSWALTKALTSTIGDHRFYR